MLDTNGNVVQQGGTPLSSTLGVHHFFKPECAPPLDLIPQLKDFGKAYSHKELSSGIDIVLDKMQSMTLAGKQSKIQIFTP